MIVTLEQLHQKLTAEAVQRNAALYKQLTDDANARHKEVMTGEDDLKAAEAALGTSISAAVAKLSSDATALAAAAGDPDADIETIAQDLATKAKALDAAVNPPGTSASSSTETVSGASAS